MEWLVFRLTIEIEIVLSQLLFSFCGESFLKSPIRSEESHKCRVLTSMEWLVREKE